MDECIDFGSSKAKREFVHISFDDGSLWNLNVGLIVLNLFLFNPFRFCILFCFCLISFSICLNQQNPPFYCLCFSVAFNQTCCKFVGETTQVPYFYKNNFELGYFGRYNQSLSKYGTVAREFASV